MTFHTNTDYYIFNDYLMTGIAQRWCWDPRRAPRQGPWPPGRGTQPAGHDAAAQVPDRGPARGVPWYRAPSRPQRLALPLTARCAARLLELGAVDPVDLKDMRAEDFESVDMKKLEVNRLTAAAQKL